MKYTLLNVLLLFVAVFGVSAAEMPDGYYNAADGKSDAELKGTLKSIIRTHTAIEYGSGVGNTWEVFYYSDRDPQTGLCMDMYCDDWKPLNKPGDVAAGCNIEHSFAKSWWGGAEVDAYKDCYHLNPSNSTANSARGNYPPGNVTTPTQTAGSLKIGKRHHDKLGVDHFIFEPKDEYKGDFARAYFYMATCYGRDIYGNREPQFSEYNGWRLDNPDVGSRFAMQNDNYLEFQDWLIDVLIAWHRQDPVSIKEINRANAVNDFQHNRNPFIDYPCLAEYIWGNRRGEAVDMSTLKFTRDADYLSLPEEDKCGCSNEITKPTITAPRHNSTIEFATAAVGESVRQTLVLNGALLTKPVTLTVSSDQFVLSHSTLTAEQVLAGVSVTIDFEPTRLGTHNATLTISSSELPRATVVNLTALCAFHAKPATEIDVNGFTANWSDAGVDEYTIDVYTRETRSGTITEVVNATSLSQSVISANENLECSGSTFSETDGIRLGTGSGNGTLKIVKVDLSRGGTLIVTAKSYGSDGSSMKISAGTFEKTVVLTNSYADYQFDIPATSATEIAINQIGTKKRIVVSAVKLLAGGTSVVDESIDGYPKVVSGTSHFVQTAVSDDKPLYYVVTPKGGEPSNVILVKLSGSESIQTAIETTETNQILVVNLPFGIKIAGVNVGSTLRLFDISGRLLETRVNCAENESFVVSSGIYLLNIDGKQTLKVVR